MYCPTCGTQNDDNAFRCTACQAVIQDVQPPSNGVDDDPVLRFILPVGQSGLAIAASYAGLFSMLLVFGPLAIVLGILALRDIKRNPKKRGKWRAIFGLVMGILGTIGLLALCAAMISSPSRS